MSEYLCNLVVPGFPKSGTSSLHAWLDTHPEIQMSPVKEPHFFSVSANWRKGSAWHNALFRTGSEIQYYGESSTTYCIHTRSLERMRSAIPDAKIILILRQPVMRIVSHYKWLWSLGLETEPLGSAIDSYGMEYCPDRSIRGNYKGYLLFSEYSRFVPMWQDSFPDRCLIVFYEQLARDPYALLKKCWNFLDLDPVDHDQKIWKNRTREASLIERRQFTVLKQIAPEGLRRKLRRTRLGKVANKIGRRPIHAPRITDAELKKLEDRLSDETAYYLELRKARL